MAAQMRYPYTLGAQLVRFPFKNHLKNWVYKAYALGLVLTVPLMAKITYSIPEEKPKQDGGH